MEIIFWTSVFITGYVYLGYPLLLYLLSVIVGSKRLPSFSGRGARDEGGPFVTLIISAYNEERVIRRKLTNALALDYPKDKLEILVVSDCSTDGTDVIVKNFQGQGVTLLRLEGRHGKTYGLNQAVAIARGEVIVFSDANAMYEPDTIWKLVRHFADEGVGYVVGESRYMTGDSSATRNENFYWRYEQFLKRKESDTGSVVGGDGALYAIRKVLYEPLGTADINDFVNPLQIIAKGYTGVYEPEAVCWEETAGTYQGEFRRKIRIVNRALRGLWQVRQVLNPLKYGFFSWKLVSHKLIRWFVPPLLITAFLSNLALIDREGFQSHPYYTLLFAIQGLFYFLALLGYGLAVNQPISKSANHVSRFTFHASVLFTIPYYFCLVNLAAMIGVLKTLRGQVTVTWNPERVDNRTAKHSESRGGKRESKKTRKPDSGRVSEAVSRPSLSGSVVLGGIVVAYLATLVVSLVFDGVARYVFWGAMALAGYGYVGYPLVLTCLTAFRKRGGEAVRSLTETLRPAEPSLADAKEIYPTVSLIIPAYNEHEIIRDKIKNSLSLDYPADKLEIVVASDGSTDGTDNILREYDGRGITAHYFSPRSGKMGALNKTLSRVASEIVVFSDANTMYRPDTIQKLVRNFHDSTVGAVSGQVILMNTHVSFGHSENLYYRYERYLQKKETALGSMLGADGAMYAIRRKLFSPPPNDTILDDFVIAMGAVRAGYRIVYEPEAIGDEETSPNLKSEFNRKSRIVAGAVQMMKRGYGIPASGQKRLWFQFLSHKFLRWVMPLVLIALFAANLRLAAIEVRALLPILSGAIASVGATSAGTSPSYLGIYSLTGAIQIIFYLLSVCGVFFNRVSLTAAPQYFCTVNAASLLGLIKGLTNKQPVTWKTFSRSVNPNRSS
ncbi:glycosyltransferase family 2 protein [Candidatus Poribacteria bacterium]|nr:glycosyltransferase family 2 protein [Candidatus Poribacteria bacterium]